MLNKSQKNIDNKLWCGKIALVTKITMEGILMKKFLKALLVASMVFATAACSQGEKETTHTGSAKGFAGDVVVEVSVKGKEITNITATCENETPGIGVTACERIPASVVEYQSLDVDAMSGATVTSEALFAAITAALADAGLKPSDLNSKTNTGATQNVTKDVDVVVVGAGGAGLAAAIEAKNAGKSVVILEKTAMSGGNTSRSTGGMNAAKTDLQDKNTFDQAAGVEKGLKAAEAYPELADLLATVKGQWDAYKANPTGYFDSIELFMLDTLVGGKNLNNYELVKTLATNSADGIKWMNDVVGAPLVSVGSFGGASVMRIHRPLNDQGKTTSVGAYIIPKLTATAENLGIEFLYETPATEILMKDGKAVGVVGKKGESTVTVNAKSVVIATGGFGADLAYVAELKPELDGFITTNAPSITGDGIKMATAIGANTVDMEQIQIHPTVHQETSALITEGLRGDGAILVNQEGSRFCDEVGTRDFVSGKLLEQTGGYAYLIVDQAMVDASSVIAGYITKGLTANTEGQTAEELAATIGCDGATLAKTIADWNECVTAKEDKMGFERTSFAKQLLDKYYAIKIAPGVHHTMGGLEINTNAEVLDTNGNVISGLYAAGEVTGGVHGANRLGGNAVSDIIVFGRIAGQNAAANAK